MSFSDRPLSFAGSQESSFIVWLIVAPERWTWALLPVRRGIPRVHFVLPRLAPRVERVVHHHAVLQHLVVVGEVARETEGDRCEPGRLRREVQVRGIRSADDKGALPAAFQPSSIPPCRYCAERPRPASAFATP